jgi:TonB family protein
MPSRSDSKPSSNITVVGVEITVTKSGKVQDLRLFSGTASLGPAAVRAIKRKKYREFAGRTVLMAVTFSSDDNAVVSVRELAVAGISGCGGTVPEVVRVGKEVMQKLLINRVEPLYPVEAQATHIGGTVTLRLFIDEHGNVSKIETVAGPELLVPAAVDAVKQWKYKPFFMSGEPRKVETTADVTFVP